MGAVNTYHHGEKDHRTLDTNGFRIGDSLDVSIYYK